MKAIGQAKAFLTLSASLGTSPPSWVSVLASFEEVGVRDERQDLLTHYYRHITGADAAVHVRIDYINDNETSHNH